MYNFILLVGIMDVSVSFSTLNRSIMCHTTSILFVTKFV